MSGLSLRITKTRHTLKLFGYFMLFKLALEYVYVRYASQIEPVHYGFHFCTVKYIYGFFWLAVVFFLIRHDKKQASSFFLQFIYTFQLIPITVIYEMKDENTAYYSMVLFSVAVCAGCVMHIKNIHCNFRLVKRFQGKIISMLIVSLLVFFVYNVYWTNGIPTTIALNLHDVYKLRASGLYKLGKYAGYLQDMLIKVFIPILLTKFILGKQYFSALLVYGFEFLIYLYAAQKMFLFNGLMIMGVLFFAMRHQFPLRFWEFFCIAYAIICLGIDSDLCKTLYNFIVRRLFFVTAVNSFYYFDFFSCHPFLGVGGMFPRWLFPIESEYNTGNVFDTVPHQIGSVYYNNPQTNANNGFIAEGFERFGFPGILLEMLVFTIVLKLIDGFQDKTNYVFAIGCCVSIIHSLGDTQLLGPMLFGYIGAWILFMLLYRRDGSEARREDDYCMKSRKKSIS